MFCSCHVSLHYIGQNVSHTAKPKVNDHEDVFSPLLYWEARQGHKKEGKGKELGIPPTVAHRDLLRKGADVFENSVNCRVPCRC